MRCVPVLVLLAGLLTACSAPAPAQSPPSSDPAPVAATPAPPAPVVVLDPGHNGGNATHPEQIGALVPAGGFEKPCNTTGTSTDDGYPEHAYAFDVAVRVADLLRARGTTVVMTRTDDTGVGPCVDARAALADDAGAALAVSIHADGAAAAATGYHVIEPGLAPDGRNAAVLDASDVAARDLLAAFGAATGLPRATYLGDLVEPGLTRRSDLAGLNLARTPSVLLESGNMRNAGEAALLTDPAWRQRAAQGIADGISAFLVRDHP
ncbi:N-acetylmuramoyl-L-alanine amidase [Kineococcus rhizosphaerae]|uniref:N-acetylmuramoyl-L-alanine amidase n=1 Tax=Kineococcus rhizosphaerae TaxID=559628 RepID=UPI001B805676|nr:N-acetylmuramoyl-L-alanine amidase [Kineococcus rhizosphaerae]